MSSSEKRLRKVLKLTMMFRPLLPDDWWYHQEDKGRWECAVEQAENILAASETTDLERLEKWLKNHKLSGELDDIMEGQQAFIEYQLEHIANELGGKEEEEG